MKHFYDRIDGWFNYAGLYDKVIECSKKGSHIIEIGAYEGRSSAYLVTNKVNSKKDIRIDIIDTWFGSEEHNVRQWMMPRFIQNMRPVHGHYNPVCLPSVVAAQLYQSVDFVFIDGSHQYHNVLADIKAWKHKTAILAGHDFKPDVFPGVCRAVKEQFSKVWIDPRSSVWAVVVDTSTRFDTVSFMDYLNDEYRTEF